MLNKLTKRSVLIGFASSLVVASQFAAPARNDSRNASNLIEFDRDALNNKVVFLASAWKPFIRPETNRDLYLSRTITVGNQSSGASKSGINSEVDSRSQIKVYYSPNGRLRDGGSCLTRVVTASIRAPMSEVLQCWLEEAGARASWDKEFCRESKEISLDRHDHGEDVLLLGATDAAAASGTARYLQTVADQAAKRKHREALKSAVGANAADGSSTVPGPGTAAASSPSSSSGSRSKNSAVHNNIRLVQVKAQPSLVFGPREYVYYLVRLPAGIVGVTDYTSVCVVQLDAADDTSNYAVPPPVPGSVRGHANGLLLVEGKGADLTHVTYISEVNPYHHHNAATSSPPPLATSGKSGKEEGRSSGSSSGVGGATVTSSPSSAVEQKQVQQLARLTDNSTDMSAGACALINYAVGGDQYLASTVRLLKTELERQHQEEQEDAGASVDAIARRRFQRHQQRLKAAQSRSSIDEVSSSDLVSAEEQRALVETLERQHADIDKQLRGLSSRTDADSIAMLSALKQRVGNDLSTAREVLARKQQASR